ncbi:MAG: bifunctional riboflavin kinase/FAD synthetase [Candidatus Nitricoxidivorans perseverans]|uniref:Riboflavin biosynthesis protein n=1 Tax=Candidatus Nitricoxidivorans perseverans TaxID=2975601 RepID=A0AA49FKB9_9PROT|nr:MAG: bifunctional riboflavin kinase/FAD synthetase [Candidatus Nitricoxidivorans perseverans]
MRVLRTIPEHAATPTVLAIGNFDGVHLGHRALLARLVTKACDLGLPPSVMTFEPHPRELFSPEQAPARLTSLREKLELLEAHGVERTYVLHFSRKLAALTAEEFIERILVRGLAVRHLIIGDDFRFGRGRAGDFDMLKEAGAAHGFGVEAMHTVDIGGERVSSSAVREALAAGDLEHAARLLGRPYNIAGRVVHGNRLGHQLGFPTANIQLKRKRVALAGIFAVTVSGLDKRHLPGAASLGVRPTLGQGLKPVLEVHLFDFDREIYGEHLTVHFLHKLRDEMKFDGLDALKAQIARDVETTKAYFDGRL